MKRLGFAAAISLLAGCATTPTPSPGAASSPAAAQSPSPAAEPPQAAARSAVATVELDAPLSGRLALRIHRPSDGATNGGSLLFELQGSQRQGQLLLQTPIGTTLAQVKWDEGGAEAITPQGKRRATTLDEVTQSLLGETLPMAALLRWLRGEPWDGAPHQAQPEGFAQLGWSISLEAWHENIIVAHRPVRHGRPNDTDIVVRARIDAKPGEKPL